MLLFKTLRSSTLKLAFIYVTGFSSAIFGVLGYVYWSTIVYVTERSDRAIAGENAALDKAYDAAGRNGLTAVIDRRLEDRFFDDWVYLLADPAQGRVAGNLPQWPASLGRGAGWADFDAIVEDRQPSKATPLRASYRTLPDGFHLLVGRKADDLGHFRKMIGDRPRWPAAVPAAGAAAGISTSRRTVARIEAINTTGRRIIEAGLHQRIPLRGTRDEWDELAQNLNSMLDRIEELVESNRQVSDNVAHDLRTPLTRMRGRLERAHHRRLDNQYQALIGNDTIASSIRDSCNLSHCCGSPIEARIGRLGISHIDPMRIAREVADLFDPAAEEKGPLPLNSRRSLRDVVGDRDLLLVALSISSTMRSSTAASGARSRLASGPSAEARLSRSPTKGRNSAR